jgi:hypothetical protein
MTQIKLLVKTLALFLVMCVFATNLKSQINIQFNNINEYLFNTKQVLNLSVINLNTKPVDVYFIGFIKDGQSQRVVEFKTNTTTLNQGNNLLNSMNFDFSELNYLNPDILEIEEKSGSYPYGLYSICIQVRCVTSDCNGLGATASSSEEITCINVNIENPTPLILAHPEDESEIEETKPLYTWIPPSPVARSSNLNYTMRLVEMIEGQNKSDALTMNRPIIEMSGIGQPSLMHPLDVPELEKGKWYAWQVEAFVGNTPIAQSEQWKFKVKKEELKKDTIRYIKLSEFKNASFYTVLKDEILYFTIEGNYKNNLFKLFLYNDQKKLLKTSDILNKTEDNKINLGSENELFGDYKLFLELSELNLIPGSFYNLELVDEMNKKYFIKFLVK